MRRALFLGFSMLFFGTAGTAAVSGDLVVTSEDVAIVDKALETKLAVRLKQDGLLTSSRQVNSYMIAVLCEYSQPPARSKPTCSFRRLKSSP